MAIPVFSELRDTLWHCVISWFYIYGIWLYISDVIFFKYVPIALLGPLVAFALVYYFRIPPPDHVIVKNLLGCDPVDVEEAKLTVSDGYYMKTCAHRFAGLDAPENSLAALRRCVEKGATFVEFDVTLSKDGIPILFHDSDINRVTNDSGTVKDMTWSQLQQLDIAAKHPLRERYQGEKIIGFFDALAACLEKNCRMFIDLKGDEMALVPHVLAAFKRYPALYECALVSSFNPLLVYAIRRADPNILGSLAWRPYSYSHDAYSGIYGAERPKFSNPVKHVIARLADTLHGCLLDKVIYYVVGISTILLHKDEMTMPEANRWRKRGVRPIAFTVNLPAEKQYYRKILRVSYMTDTLDSEGF